MTCRHCDHAQGIAWDNYVAGPGPQAERINQRIIELIAALHEDYERGEISGQAFAAWMTKYLEGFARAPEDERERLWRP